MLRGLREAFPGLKWRHQAPVGAYFADILCFSERLVIEVDGDMHAGMERHDAQRTAMIAREGFRVLRVTNTDVTENLEGVLSQISLSLREREKKVHSPSSNMSTAFCAVALSRTVSPSTAATSPAGR